MGRFLACIFCQGLNCKKSKCLEIEYTILKTFSFHICSSYSMSNPWNKQPKNEVTKGTSLDISAKDFKILTSKTTWNYHEISRFYIYENYRKWKMQFYKVLPVKQ